MGFDHTGHFRRPCGWHHQGTETSRHRQHASPYQPCPQPSSRRSYFFVFRYHQSSYSSYFPICVEHIPKPAHATSIARSTFVTLAVYSLGSGKSGWAYAGISTTISLSIVSVYRHRHGG